MKLFGPALFDRRSEHVALQSMRIRKVYKVLRDKQLERKTLIKEANKITFVKELMEEAV